MTLQPSSSRALRLVMFTPAHVQSAIGRMASQVTAALTALGCEVAVVRTEAEHLLDSPVHAFQTRIARWDDAPVVRELIQQADALVYHMGDNHQFHQGGLHWLADHPGLVCLHDFFIGHLFFEWSRHRRAEAEAVLCAWYGDDSPARYFGEAARDSFIASTAGNMPMTEWICAQAHAVITHSQWGCDRVLRSCAGPVRVVPLAYEITPLAQPRACTQLGIPAPGTVHLLTIGHVNPNKRVDSVIQAIARSPVLRHAVRYRLTGAIQPATASRLTSLAQSLGVSLTIDGEVSEDVLTHAIAQSDIVSCLRWPALEAASASAIEAMQYGKAIIVTNTAFYQEIPDDLVVKIDPDHELAQLQAALEQFVANPALAAQKGQAAQAWATKTFTARNYATQLVETIKAMSAAAPIIRAIDAHCQPMLAWSRQKVQPPDHFDTPTLRAFETRSDAKQPIKISEQTADEIESTIEALAVAHGGRDQALAFLLAKSPGLQDQVKLIGICLSTGSRDMASGALSSLLVRTDEAILPLWSLADMLESQGQAAEASIIYRSLSALDMRSAKATLFAGLATYRLDRPGRAADILEDGLSRFPESTELLDHFARICLELKAVDRAARYLADDISDPALICERLFDRCPDPQAQVSLIAHCLNNGMPALAKQKISQYLGSTQKASALWILADELLTTATHRDTANDIYRRLSTRSPGDAEDLYYAALALLRLQSALACADLLEQGLRQYPGDSRLSTLYRQVCANQLAYGRYRDFTSSVCDGAPLTETEFYEDLGRRSPIDFIINYWELLHHVGPDGMIKLKTQMLDALRAHRQPIQTARLLVFYASYLDLDTQFCSDMLRAILDSLRESNDQFTAQERSLQMLNALSPAMSLYQAKPRGTVTKTFINACQKFTDSPVVLQEPLTEMNNGWTPWQLLFCQVEPQGYAQAIHAFESLALKTWPRIQQVASHVNRQLAPAVKGQRKIRIGFNVHDSMPMMSGLLTQLDPDLFETVFLRPGPQGKSPAAASWVERAGKTIEFSDTDTYAAIDTISQQQLDIIVSGPSMGASFYPLMSRLANLQMILLEPNWTDGLSHADYYISWRPAEPDTTEGFYKTAVAYLDHPPYWIEKPAIERLGVIGADSRAEVRQRLLGAGPEQRLYLCANTPPKIHPQMDDMFDALLTRDPNAIVVLLRGEFHPARTVNSRLRERLGERFDRVIYLPTLPRDDAHLLLQAADCCLDSFPICGMSSSFDGAMLGVPTVTLPHDIPFGRWTAAIYDYIGVRGLTARNQSEYVDIAIRLANDAAWRREKATELREKSARYVESHDGASGFSNFLLAAWNRKAHGLAPGNWVSGKWL